MMLATSRRRAGWPAVRSRAAGARGQLAYATVYRRGTSPLRRLRPSGTLTRAPWWSRMMDDQELVGVKLLVLAVLLMLTAALERVV